VHRQLLLMLFLAALTYGVADAIGSSAAKSISFDQALHAAIEDPEQTLSMQIECTNEKGIRSLHLYSGGVAIWNQQVQVNIDSKIRAGLLEALLKADFPSFKTHYGGKAGSGRIKAPNIVMCSIQVQTGGVEKVSYQDVNGDRSVAFLNLAAALLDAIEPLAEQGIRTRSMAEALTLLKQRKLALQVLVLRVMHLPADAEKTGEMLRIEAGQLSRRIYQPGVKVGDWETAPIDTETFQGVIQQLLDASVWSLPANLPSVDSYQMSVTILDHSLLIRSRSLNNQAVQQKTVQGVNFTSLANSLFSLNPLAETNRME